MGCPTRIRASNWPMGGSDWPVGDSRTVNRRYWRTGGTRSNPIDTCCIDKKSSAELSEAINSMYKWYEKSEKCYAYLEDVSSQRTSRFWDNFSESSWFKRGWTLQELIAPMKLKFFAEDWKPLGNK